MTSLRSAVRTAAALVLPLAFATSAAARTEPIIADHTKAKLNLTSEAAISQAKEKLHIAYGHTSHGSQITEGMAGLEAWKGALYAWSETAEEGKLHLDDYAFTPYNDIDYMDLGNPNRTIWEEATRAYLAVHPETNVVMWSWCGGADASEAEIDLYLSLMSGLEEDYPDVKFVYMTGHLVGTGTSGNLHQRNEQIRAYVRANNKILFDFADIESFDPDGVGYNTDTLLANDFCDYDTSGDGYTEGEGDPYPGVDQNWAVNWQNAHKENVDWYSCGAAHSQALNANLKAYAAWWLWGQLAVPALSLDADQTDGVVEGNGTGSDASFTALMDAAAAETVTVQFATSNGTAEAGSDYTFAEGTLTFEPGETTKTITILITGDTNVESNETFNVTLSNAVGATIEKATGVGTILDDDTVASIADVSVAEGSSAHAVDLNVSLSRVAPMDISIDFATSNGSAEAGSDYQALSGSINIPAGNSSGTLSLTIYGDTVGEPNETFTVTFSNPVGATLANTTATVTITNDDVVVPTLSIADRSQAEGNSGTANMPFTVTLSAASATDVTVGYATADGTATQPSDYTTTTGTLTITAGQLTGTINVPIVGDADVEANETLTVSLANPSGATIADGSALGTITNDDAAETTPVVWTSAVGVTVSGNSLTKTAANGWNAGAVSTQQLASGDGYVQVVASELTTHRMFGLGVGNSGTYYTDIEFAIYCGGSGIQVYEAGTLRGTFGTYATGDALQVAVESGSVKYKKNGTTFYTSTVTPLTYPLVVDTSLYSQGATLNAASLGGTWTTPATETAPVIWTAAVGVSASGNSLTKTETAAGWNAGAVSSQQLVSGDGYVQVTGSELTTHRMFGLGVGNTGTSYTDIEFAIYCGGGGIQVYEAGTLRGTFGTYATGDTLQVAVEAGLVKYKRNGETFYTSEVEPVYPLVVDASLHTQAATLNTAVVRGNWLEAVNWTSATGVLATGSSLRKTETAAGWNAGAVSSQQLASGDGYVQVTASELTTHRMFGLGVGNTGTYYTDIEFAIYCGGSGIQVYEGGALRGTFGTYATGDTLQVAVEAGIVKYKRNGATFYTSEVTPTYPLLVDASLHTQNATLNAASLGGTWTTPVVVTTPVAWASAVGVTVSGNSLTKTAAAGWNAGAVSTQHLASGDGYVQVTASELTSHRMFGLGVGNSGTYYTDIEFAIYCGGNGLQVYEAGTLRGSFGTYATGDTLQVAVESGVVKYKRNGTIFFTSTVTPLTYPLVVDASLYTQNATLNAVAVGGNWE